jgi:hypothetical protein
MATATAGDQIRGALRLIGMLAEGETPSNDTMTDSLTALVQMIDSWSTERLMIYSTQDQVFTWPANQATRTLGPSGNFVGVRPAQPLDDSTYFKDSVNGVSYGISFVNQEQYNSIALKTATSNYPQVAFANMTYPNIEITVYPVPTQNLEWHLVSVRPLTEPATLFTNLSFPPGYLRAFKYNLACELAAEFGVEPPKTVQRLAMTSKRNLKRINNPDDLMSMPLMLTNNSRFNIYTGGY